jgi:hypothetical protein
MIGKLKDSGKDVIIAGDGRHDSMGHSAKFCAYTTYCSDNSHIIDFSFVQVNYKCIAILTVVYPLMARSYPNK